MNKKRRNEIRAIISKLKGINFANEKSDMVETIEDLKDDVACVLDEEECYRDNMPENLQNGYRYEAAEEACDNLENAYDVLDSIDVEDNIDFIIKSVNEVMDYLSNAM